MERQREVRTGVRDGNSKKKKKETGREKDNKGVVKLKWRDSCETPSSLPHNQLATWRSVGSTPLRELEGMEGDSN